MATVSTVSMVARVRRLLDEEPLQDYISGTITVTGTQGVLDSSGVSLQNLNYWSIGDIVEPRDNVGEQMKIHATWNGSTNPVPVIRGHNDTTPNAHTITGCEVYKNPRFAYQDVFDAITNTLSMMWPSAWATGTITIAASALDYGNELYALASGATGVSGITGTLTGDLVSVLQDATSSGTTKYKVYQYGAPKSGKPVGIVAAVPNTISASGYALYLPSLYTNTVPLVVNCIRYLETTDIQDGLMSDTVAFGAAARVLAMRQVVRSGQDIRSGEPGSSEVFLQDTQYFQSLYQSGLRRLHMKLMADPSTRKMPRWAGP